MLRSLWTAASGMQAQALNVDVLANNLANVNTSGFKRARADFQDLLYQTIRAPGSSSSSSTQVPTGIQLGHGVRTAAIQKIFSQGDYKNTGNELDLAIEGEGFFQITKPDGDIGYTRDGTFKLDNEGRLVNSDGYLLEPEITIPADSLTVSIGSDGTVSVMQAGQSATTEIGTIQLANFINPAGLNAIGKNMFLPTASSGDVLTGTAGEDGFGTLAQGFIEMSNVSVVEEMVNLITAQRAYEINSKAIQTSDEMLGIANQIKR